MAAKLAKEVAASTVDWDQTTTIPSTGLTLPSGNYMMIWYSNADKASIVASGKAITEWYKAGNPEEKVALYDYKTSKCSPTKPKDVPAWVSEDKDKETLKVYAAEVLSCNNFRKMLWSDATNAVFATRGNWAVAWVKYDSASPVDASMVYTPRTAVGNWPADP